MLFTKKDVVFFKNAILRESVDGDNPIIIQVEGFLLDWIKQTDMRREEMQVFAEIMKEIPQYRFAGTIYRGVFDDGREDFDVNDNLHGSAVSFTDYKNVALKFAGIETDGYEAGEDKSKAPIAISYLIEAEVTDAFSFDDFLRDYQDISNNTTLLNEIDSFLGENEKIHTNEQVEFVISTL